MHYFPVAGWVSFRPGCPNCWLSQIRQAAGRSLESQGKQQQPHAMSAQQVIALSWDTARHHPWPGEVKE
ncbi:hypothetical protein RRG08_052783 [Elysia crispata]|uniref:Uncharacterized protein n=1 Tax=Elysia crispata TaxID=231223 RepID=A0AAE1EBC4_9GAST|nr:hypothetical protein RRG08_052783 [Elysia crispata]